MNTITNAPRQLTSKIQFTLEGAIVAPDITKDELKAGWAKAKILKAAGAKIERDLRQHSITTWGEDETINLEGSIISELGFAINVLKENTGDEEKMDLPSTDKFLKSFDAISERWEIAIKQGGQIEYLKQVYSALSKPVEMAKRIERYLYVNRDA